MEISGKPYSSYLATTTFALILIISLLIIPVATSQSYSSATYAYI